MKIATKLDKNIITLLLTASKSYLKEIHMSIALVEQCTTCGCFHTLNRVKANEFVEKYGPMKKWVHKFVQIAGIGISYVVPGMHVCYDCHIENMHQLVRVFNRPDETIQSMTFYHGLLTGMCDYDRISPVTAMRKFMDIVDNMGSPLEKRWEICAATMPIGPVGIRISGQVNLAGNGDLWSSTGSEGGERSASPRHFYKLVTRREDLEVLSPGETHNEVFIQIGRIDSAWVDTSYKYRDEMVEFFTSQGIPVK